VHYLDGRRGFRTSVGLGEGKRKKEQQIIIVRSDSEVDGRVVEAVLLRYVCVFVFLYVSMYMTLFFSAIHTHAHQGSS
jgi:hypothetical protein